MSDETHRTKAQKRGKPIALIIDDDKEYVATATLQLSKLGFFVYSASEPEDFLKKFKQHQPQFCFIGLNIGSATLGFTLIEAVRIKQRSDIPLFVVSAECNAKIIAHSIELGATDYLVKPVDAELLAARLSPYFTSEGIAEVRLPFVEVPKDRSPASLSLDFELRSVDENGLTLVCQHLVTKGSVIQIKAPVLEQITGRGDTHLVTILNTWAEPGLLSYAAYAEFDQAAEDLLTGVRRWLLSRALVPRKE